MDVDILNPSLITPPEVLPNIEDTSQLEQGAVFHWNFNGSAVGVAGNSQTISPFVTFQTPYRARLIDIKVFIWRSSSANVRYDQNKYEIDIYPSPANSGVLINSPINVGTAVNVPFQVQLFGDTFRGQNQFSGLDIDLKPGQLYQMDIVIQETIALNDNIFPYVFLTLQKK